MAEALYQMYNLTLRLDIKHTVDGGKVSVGDATAAPNGTEVFFTKPFKDVDSITVTAEGPVSLNAIYDFVDVPNPVSFRILLFNTAGARVAGNASWKARGKI
jgi:hypothetical protein